MRPCSPDDEWAAFERYMEGGGGYAGIHAASDCCDESAWYGELLGNQARFANHPGGVGGSPGCIGDFPGDPNVVEPHGLVLPGHDRDRRRRASRPRTTCRKRWDISDEWYNFKANPRSTVHVLQTLDESSYNFQPHPFIRNWGTLMGADHPITWCQVYDGGRVWYTGHRPRRGGLRQRGLDGHDLQGDPAGPAAGGTSRAATRRADRTRTTQTTLERVADHAAPGARRRSRARSRSGG